MQVGLDKLFTAQALEKPCLEINEKTGVEDSVRCTLEHPTESVGEEGDTIPDGDEQVVAAKVPWPNFSSAAQVFR